MMCVRLLWLDDYHRVLRAGANMLNVVAHIMHESGVTQYSSACPATLLNLYFLNDGQTARQTDRQTDSAMPIACKARAFGMLLCSLKRNTQDVTKLEIKEKSVNKLLENKLLIFNHEPNR